jgi:hypothetical protein
MGNRFAARFVVRCLFVSSLIMLGVREAGASIIDLRNLPNNFEQLAFGRPNTVFYAQSVIADDLFLNEGRVRLRASSGTSILFNFLVTGDRVDGGGGLGFAPDLNDIRYNSGMLSAPNSATLTEFTVTPNIPVINGERLFLVFDTLSYPTSGSGPMWATQFNAAVDPYPAGEFVFFNQTGQTTFAQVNALPWDHRSVNNEDLGILAKFSSIVPEPGCTVGVVSVMLLAGSAVRRRGR